MAARLSPRLKAIVEALPLENGMRVLEIGCGPGAAAREVAVRIGDGYVLGIDRSAKAIEAAVAGSGKQIASGRLGFRRTSAEDFELHDDEEPFDLAFAIRVGAFDGRHSQSGRKAARRLRRALKPGATLFIDGGNPLRKVELD